ncbi:ATP-grasp domain-containing protein [Hymenobacter terrenus]|uniref:ATP-grasp domain-containing protein n=1 Tax=Hymenobacter terrenus TaxID=1629124 RepID=UPI00061937B9|nr:ATP-grasp domain-containing protein [Hymenobacter terrenus]
MMPPEKEVHWVLQRNLLPPPMLAAFRQAFTQQAISHEEVVSIPFSRELPMLQKPTACCVFYGSTTLVMNAYHTGRYAAGVFYDSSAFTMTNYLAHWPEHMLNHDVAIQTLGRFVAQPLPADSQWFVRPNDDTKTFAGRVMSFDQLREWHQQLAAVADAGADLTADSLLLFSSPKVIDKEWRHFIVGGQVVSSARYQQRGELSVSGADVPADLLAFVVDCCAAYQPHAVFVLDTALADGRYWVIECNCFNGTGFYQPAAIADVVAAVTGLLRQKLA